MGYLLQGSRSRLGLPVLRLIGASLIFLAGLLTFFPGRGYTGTMTQGQPDVGGQPAATFRLDTVGVVRQQGESAYLEILPKYAPALQGLEGFSHVWVFYWFHGNDRPEERATLKVHPRRNPANPLTGVFATRAPVRPNLIGITACRILKVQGNVVEVAGLDALDGSPILDLKPYIPEGDSIPGAKTPEWVKGLKSTTKGSSTR
jgi:tRNA (adenine37-N6)-methyltransferase